MAARTTPSTKGMPPEVFESTFNAALKEAQDRGGAGATKISAEEADKLKSAFEKPEFRKMFQEYVDEISDPKHREEYEQYLAQLEKEEKVPEDMELIRPKPGFCIKTLSNEAEEKDAKKVFINICHSEKVEKATMESSKEGQNWSVPNTMGPPRMEKDNKGVSCITFDVCFNPETLQRAQHSKPFKKMVCSIAMEGVGTKWSQHANKKVTLNEKYHVLKRVPCMGGTPAVMSVRKGAKPEAGTGGGGGSKGAAAKPSSAAAASGAGHTAAGRASEASRAEAAAAKTPAALRKAAKAASAAKAPPAPTPTTARTSGSSGAERALSGGIVVPAYTITHRGQFDLADHMKGGPDTNSQTSRPRELVVRIELGQLKSAKTVDLDVTPTMLNLTSPDKYALELELPFPVHDERGAAKFDKGKRTLTVTLPVKKPPKQKKAKVASMVTEVASSDAGAKAGAGAGAGAGASASAAAVAAASAPAPTLASPTPEEEEPETEAQVEAARAKAKAEAEAALRAKKPVDHSRWVSGKSGDADEDGSPARGESDGAAGAAARDAKAAKAREERELKRKLKQAAEEAKVAQAKAAAAKIKEDSRRAAETAARAREVLEKAKAQMDSRASAKTASGSGAEAVAEPPFEWRQKSRSVVLLVNVAQVDGDSVELKVEPWSVDLSFRDMSGKQYRLAFTPQGELNPATCRHDLASRNMVVVLGKVAGSKQWTDLRKAGSAAPATAAVPTAAPAAAAATPAPPVQLSGPFVAAAAFEGARPGYVFKTGGSGLGYYKDGPAEAPPTTAKAAAAKTNKAKASQKQKKAAEDEILELGADGSFDIAPAANKSPPRSQAKVTVHTTQSSAGAAAGAGAGSSGGGGRVPHPITGAVPVQGEADDGTSGGGGDDSGTASAPVKFSNTLIHELD